MAIKCGVRGGSIVKTGFDPGNPGSFWEIGDVGYDVGPGFRGVTGNLEIAVICADPNSVAVAWRFADGINCGMRLGIGVVHGHTAGLFLLLFFRIIGGEIRRNAIPGLAMVA